MIQRRRWQPRLRILVGVSCVLFAGRQALGQRLLADGISDLSTQIVTGASEAQKHRIAVIPFRELDGQSTVLGTYLAESLTTQLFRQKGFEISERTLLDKIMAEMQLGSTGIIDPATAARIGKVAGVEAIVTGSVTDFQSSVAVNCRLIDVATGRVFGAAEARIVKDDDVKAVMGRPMNTDRLLQTGLGPTLASIRAESNGFLFQVDRCRASGPTLECLLTITNQWEDRFFEVSTESKAFDEAGQGYRVLDRVWTGKSAPVVAGARMQLRIRFQGEHTWTSVRRLDVIGLTEKSDGQLRANEISMETQMRFGTSVEKYLSELPAAFFRVQFRGIAMSR